MATKRKATPLGDLHETVEEVRAELSDETPKVPRYTSDGILLNPEDFDVQSDGTLKPKVG